MFAFFLFLLSETVVTLAWRPAVIGAKQYQEISLTYDYGYTNDIPRMFGEGDSLCYYPTEYVNMPKFSLDKVKKPNEIRIFVLGGSVTRGGNVPFGKAYPERLATLLTEHHPEYKWTVLNLAAPGFGSTRMWNVMKKMAPYEPDAIIVHPHGSNEYEDERDARYRDQLHAGVNGIFLGSHLIVLAKKFVSQWLDLPGPPQVPKNGEQIAGRDPVNRDRWFSTLTENIQQFEKMAADQGIATIYVGRSEREGEGYGGENVDHLNTPIHDLQHFTDVAALFRLESEKDPDAKLFSDWTHYSITGHQIMSEELFDLLCPNGKIFRQIASRRKLLDNRKPL